MAVVNDSTLVGECSSDRGTGCIMACKNCQRAAGCLRNGSCFTAILIGEGGVIAAVIRSDEQNVRRGCVTHFNDFAVGCVESYGTFFGYICFNFVAEPVVVCTVHSVDGKEETVGGEIGKAVCINIFVVESSGVNGVDNVACGKVVSKCFGFGNFNCRPSIIHAHRQCCICRNGADFLCKCNGNDAEHHQSGEHNGHDSACFHVFRVLLYC